VAAAVTVKFPAAAAVAAVKVKVAVLEPGRIVTVPGVVVTPGFAYETFTVSDVVCTIGFPLPSCDWITIEPEVVAGLPVCVVNDCAAVSATSVGVVFVSMNRAVGSPVEVAITWYLPSAVPAVRLAEEAIPFTFVTAVQVFTTAPPDATHAPPVASSVPL
jgi:hypothetical protein